MDRAWLTEIQNFIRLSYNYTAQYIDNFEELPYDTDTMRRHIERLITVSAPLQTMLSDLRHLYRWDNPARTGKWMALYFFLWSVEHIGTFIVSPCSGQTAKTVLISIQWGLIVYRCLMNYFYPSSVEELRKGMERSLDRGATAFKVGELMDQYGNKEWLEPLLDQIGPALQVQIMDLANFFEVVYNFYHWSNPAASRNTLILFATCFLVAALGTYEFVMKGVWFLVGFGFFVNWPISSLYPRYRLVVSPFKLIFWDVPTHAETCFNYLRDRATLAREAILSNATKRISNQLNGPPTACAHFDLRGKCMNIVECEFCLKDEDILRMVCTYHHTLGHFIISTSRLRFEPFDLLSNNRSSFSNPYTELVEMTKRTTTSSMLSPVAKSLDLDKLELTFKEQHPNISGKDAPRAVLLENMKERDKAFNAIIGFSGLRWQNIQKEPDIDKKPTK